VSLTTSVVVSGHMVDEPGRESPRFPAERVPVVTARIRAVLAAWEVGPATTVVSGGARGADIIVAEEALDRGAQVVLCLALEPEEFEQASVAIADTDWSERFRRLLRRAEVRVLEHGSPDDPALYARTNRWLLDVARSFGEPKVILVWNGQRGDGPGGTEEFARLAGPDEPDPDRIRVIDPLA
jgi:NAD(P)-dependent dehydrogenase (short-subunit alcohol dehydrogenase family)